MCTAMPAAVALACAAVLGFASAQSTHKHTRSRLDSSPAPSAGPTTFPTYAPTSLPTPPHVANTSAHLAANGSDPQNSTVPVQNELVGDDWTTEASNDDFAWKCDAFDNDADDRFDNATCASADGGLCEHFCTQCAWCSYFCTDRCDEHQGAVCGASSLVGCGARPAPRPCRSTDLPLLSASLFHLCDLISLTSLALSHTLARVCISAPGYAPRRRLASPRLTSPRSVRHSLRP